MQLTEITQREVAQTSKKTQAWADRRENRPTKQLTRYNIDLNKVIGPHLRKQGLKNLGKGQFAVVYGRPGSGRVVKVSKKEDYCWLQYAEWCMKQRNPHVPVIYHLESYEVSIDDTERPNPYIRFPSDTPPEEKTKGVPVFFAVMESLNPFKLANIDIKANLPLLAYLSEYVDGVHVPEEVFAQALGVPLPTYGDRDPEQSNKFWRKIDKLTQQGSKHAAVKLFKKVEHMWERCSGDMHDGNLMIRPSTGEIVITDPIFEPKAMSQGRW